MGNGLFPLKGMPTINNNTMKMIVYFVSLNKR